MMHVALVERRISVPILLKIKLEVVSRPGVCFADCNATRLDARKSTNPSIVHFDVVKKKSQFDVAPSLQRFYQAEVLIPSPIPPHLIDFPSKSIKLPVKKKVTAHKVNAKSMKVSEATRKDDCLSPHKIKRVEICSEFSEPESVEAKSVELCEGESSDKLCHILFSSSTSSQATAVVEEVETPSCSLMLSVLTDQGVGEFVAQPLPEVHVPAGCEVKTRRTVRANSADQIFDLSVLTRLKDSSQVQTHGDNSVVKFNAWLINMLLFDYLNCMLLLIVAFIRSLRERLLTLPLLHRLRLQRGCKLFSAMGSPPPLIVHDSSRCEFSGGKEVCLNESVTGIACHRG